MKSPRETKPTNLQQFISTGKGQDAWVALDVHRKTHHIAVMRADGEKITVSRSADNGEVVKLLRKLEMAIRGVAYEAGPTGFSLARAVADAGYPVYVAAASKLPRAPVAGAKCDRLDCLKLVEYLANGMIHPIAIPTPEEESERDLLRRRTDLVDRRRKVMQHIKSMVLFHGFEEPEAVTNWRKDAPAAVMALAFKSEARWTMASHLRELEFINAELADIESKLRETIDKGHREVNACLRSIPGVGPILATSFQLEIFSPERFEREEQLSSYLGLAPTTRRSGESKPFARVVPVGQTRLRSQLVEAAWVWKSRDPYAEHIYNNLIARIGVAAKAITALARRLAIIMWRLCIEKREYRHVDVPA